MSDGKGNGSAKPAEIIDHSTVSVAVYILGVGGEKSNKQTNDDEYHYYRYWSKNKMKKKEKR